MRFACTLTVFVVLTIGSTVLGQQSGNHRTKSVYCQRCGNVHFAARPTSSTRSNYRRPTELPKGRVYRYGRYFGNFNNRFYGPQYGYF